MKVKKFMALKSVDAVIITGRVTECSVYVEILINIERLR